MTNLQDFVKGKRFFIIASVLAIILILLMILSSVSKPQQTPNSQVEPVQDLQRSGFSANSQYQSPELKQAIAEQTKADREYAGWEKSVSDTYPWRKKLPLTSNKYYVYFDLEQKVFIGRLYPLPGDNVDQIKADIVKQLKENKGIPVENFKFDWMINP